jgi:hypothetical protein
VLFLVQAIVQVMVMKTVCISVPSLRSVNSAFGETWISLVDSVFHSDYAFWSFGHSPIIIILIFVSCSGPGDNKSVFVFMLELWLSVFEIPLLLTFSRCFR